MKAILAIIATAAIIATLMPFASMRVLAQPPQNQTNTSNNHLPVNTVQNNEFIVTTVTKNGEHPPEGPIVILPPENNATNGEGNITQLPADSNVTHEGNDTVIIAPPDRNITEVPIGPNENITIIGPPHQNESTQPAAPPCTCQNQTGNEQQKPIPPVIIAPAPGQNITQVSPPHVDNSLPTPPANANNSGLHPAHPIVIPPTSNQPGSNNNGTVSQGGNQTASDNTPKVNPLIPSTTWK
jgi:hypothetical protein